MLEEINWSAEFSSMNDFEDDLWSHASLVERQEMLEELVNTLDVSDAFEGYSFRTADLPDGVFVDIDSESGTITFDHDALNLPEARDGIISDLFDEMNIDEQISDSFKELYFDEDRTDYDVPDGNQYAEVENVSFGKSVSFGCLGICGVECLRLGCSGRRHQVYH